MRALKFKNFTDRDFTWAYDSVEYTFKAGESMFLPDFQAYHFAKHLVDEELNRLGKLTNNVKERERLGQLCFPEDVEVTPIEAIQLNEEEKPKAKSKTKKKVEDEEEFSELNDKQ